MRVLGLAALAVLAAAPALDAQIVAIEGGRVLPISGPPIEPGTVLIRDGRIAEVGAGVAVPAGAERVDATGRWVTPGLVHAATRLGLIEISSVTGTSDGAESGDVLSASFNVLEGVDPDSELIEVARAGGVTTVLSLPTGGVVSGQAVTLDLAGATVEEMRIDSPAAVVIQLGESAAAAAGGSRAAVMALLRNAFEEARTWRDETPRFRPWERDTAASPADLEALAAPLAGEIPVVATANRLSDIENALRLARDYDLRLVIRGGDEAWRIAGRLAAEGVPVLVDPFANNPSYDGLRARLDNAALLEAAGARVVIAGDGTHLAGNLRFMAGNAVANGMSWDGALRAITLSAAEALGIDDRYGSLDAGKVANVVIWNGDPLELSSVPERLWIRGRETTTESRHTRLLERYLSP